MLTSRSAQIYKLVTNDTLFPQYFESEEELITDWAWALGPLPARWSPYYDTINLRFTPDGELPLLSSLPSNNISLFL